MAIKAVCIFGVFLVTVVIFPALYVLFCTAYV